VVINDLLQLNQLQVCSCTPFWKTLSQNDADLQHTRIKDSVVKEALIFKLVTWQLLRVEASSTSDENSGDYSAPLRFITSQGRAQVTVKKSTLSE